MKAFNVSAHWSLKAFNNKYENKKSCQSTAGQITYIEHGIHVKEFAVEKFSLDSLEYRVCMGRQERMQLCNLVTTACTYEPLVHAICCTHFSHVILSTSYETETM